jgi:hypothetical protein
LVIRRNPQLRELRARHQAQATEPDVVVAEDIRIAIEADIFQPTLYFDRSSHGAVNLRSASNNLHRGCDQVQAIFDFVGAPELARATGDGALRLCPIFLACAM